MTVRDYSANARRAEEERQRRARARTRGEDFTPGDYVREDSSPLQELYRDAPTADQLTPDLFLEDGSAIPMPDSMAGAAEADALSQYHTEGALDLLAQQVAMDNSGYIGPGAQAGMQLADLAAARQTRGARDANEAQAYASGTAGSGGSIQDELVDLGGVNDALMNNYASVYNNEQDQALNSLARLGTESGALRDQTFGESFRRGSAVDAFNEHNLGYLRDVNQRNTDRMSRQSAEREGAFQQEEDNEYNLHQGAAPIRQAEAEIARQRADDDNVQQQAYDATIGSIKGILG